MAPFDFLKKPFQGHERKDEDKKRRRTLDSKRKSVKQPQPVRKPAPVPVKNQKSRAKPSPSSNRSKKKLVTERNYWESVVYYVESAHMRGTDMATKMEGSIQARIASLGMDPIPPEMILATVVSLFLSIISTILIIRTTRLRMQHKKRYGNYSLPPYAKKSRFATIRALASDTKAPWFYKECAEQVGPIFRLLVPVDGDTPMFVAVGNVDTAKEILQDATTSKESSHYSSIEQMVGGINMFTSNGNFSKLAREGIMPALSKKQHVQRINKLCNEATEEWIQAKLEPCIRKNKSLDIVKSLQHISLSTICKVVFEYKIKRKEADMVLAESKVAHQMFVDPSTFSSIPSFVARLLPSTRRGSLARERLREFARTMLKSYRTKSKIHKQEETIISWIDKSTNYDNDEQRVSDIVVLLLAGHDSTSQSAAWTLVELAKNPEEQAKLRAALVQGNDTVAQESLTFAVQEAMRLHPVVASAGTRVLGRDFYVKNTPIVIPKGSIVVFPTIVLTRNEVDNPEVFRPSRWKGHPDKSFLSFSHGKRNCVGQAFSMAEIRWVVSRLCAKYEFEVVWQSGKPNLKCDGSRLKACHAKR